MERTRFSEDKIRNIRQSPDPARKLAEAHGVTHQTILNIRSRRTYKHVAESTYTGPENEYFLLSALNLLEALPDASCPTVVTSPLFSTEYQKTLAYSASERSYFIDRQCKVLGECMRVAGPVGLVLYHDTMFDHISLKETDSWDHLLPRFMGMRTLESLSFSFKTIIIWDHLTPAPTDHSSRRQLPQRYSPIFMFAGRDWALPEKIESMYDLSGDVWGIESINERAYCRDVYPTPPGNYSSDDKQHWYSLPEGLADQCVALGTGQVLDPHAGPGDIPLAAIRAGRSWLACDTRPTMKGAFERRRNRMRTPEEDELLLQWNRGGSITT